MNQSKCVIWSIFKYIFIVCYLFSLACIGISLFPAKKLEDQFAEAAIKKGIEQKVLDTTNSVLPMLLEDDQVKTINQNLDELMTDNQYLHNIVNEYIGAVKETSKKSGSDNSISDNIDQNLIQQNISDFSNQITQKISDQTQLNQNALSNLITQKMIERITQILNDKMVTSCDEILSTSSSTMRTLLRIYSIVTSDQFRNISIIISVVLLILILVCSKPVLGCLIPLGIVHSVDGIGWMLVSMILPNRLTQELTRQFGSQIVMDGSIWMIYGLLLLGTGVILIVSGILLRNSTHN